mmetsp:Transcript_21463/g.48331  ORF Transcript_21463/g.48331 Transcript_21463/m.48331 type:complete len:246 (-) Transcript_21463:1325-2062(-)
MVHEGGLTPQGVFWIEHIRERPLRILNHLVRAAHAAGYSPFDLSASESTHVTRRSLRLAKSRIREVGRELVGNLVIGGNALNGALAHRLGRHLGALVHVGLAHDGEVVAVVQLAKQPVRCNLGAINVYARLHSNLEVALARCAARAALYARSVPGLGAHAPLRRRDGSSMVGECDGHIAKRQREGRAVPSQLGTTNRQLYEDGTSGIKLDVDMTAVGQTDYGINGGHKGAMHKACFWAERLCSGR